MSRFHWLLLTLGLCLIAPLTAQAEGPLSSTRSSSPFASTNFSNTNDAQFLPVDQAFHAYAWHDDERVYVGMRNRPGYYLYRQRFGLESHQPGIALGTLEIPAGKFKHDPYLGDVHVFYDQVVFSAPLSRDDTPDHAATIPVTLTFQGCADAGLCYPPEHWELKAKSGPPPEAFRDASDEAQSSPIGDAATATADPFSTPDEAGSALSNPAPEAAPRSNPAPEAAPFSSSSTDGRFQARLHGGIGLTTLGLFFLAGLGLTFTPCVLPMIPILTSIIVGQNARRSRALALSASYVAGMAVTFTLLGTLMGLFGASLNLQARLQSPWVLVPLALLFVLFALAMFGGFNLRLPNGISQRVDTWQARLQRSGPLGLAAAGALSVLVVSPCVSAPLAGALVFISTTGNVAGGALALLALALGMGLPLILVGTLGGAWLPRAGNWMNGVKALFGVMLLGVAIWLVERLLPGPMSLLLWGALALGCALALGALDRRTGGGWPLLRRTGGWLLLVWGVAMVWGAAQGGSDPLRPLPAIGDENQAAVQTTFQTVSNDAQLDAALAQARQAGRPAMVDVSAEWCISCKVMEREVFPAPEVAQRLAGFVLIRADVTDDVPASRQLLERYGLFGPPGLLFFADGQELRQARIQGEVDARTLANHLDAVTRQIKP